MKNLTNARSSILTDRYGDIFEYSLNGMLMIDSKGTIVLINKKIENIFGYKKKDLIEKPIETLVPDEIRKLHPSYIQSYMSNPETRYMGVGRDLYGQHKNGSKINLEIGLRPVYVENEIFVISSVTDVSYRRDIEEQISEKTNELEEFAYRISHDLKAPLLSISGLADCINDDFHDKNYGEVVENTNKIKSLASNLYTMVEKILILTKADLKNEAYDFYEFENYIEVAKQKFLKITQDKKVNITSQFNHKKDFFIEPTRMTQILDNLVNNAIKYSNDKHIKKIVEIHTKNDSNNFYIQVKDNGIGISSDKKDKVFSMFSRFHKDSAGGTGLGLYMAKKLVKKMKGEITYDSNSKGTVFKLKFPLHPK